jgi:hypothetical protein
MFIIFGTDMYITRRPKPTQFCRPDDGGEMYIMLPMEHELRENWRSDSHGSSVGVSGNVNVFCGLFCSSIIFGTGDENSHLLQP